MSVVSFCFYAGTKVYHAAMRDLLRPMRGFTAYQIDSFRFIFF